MCENVASDVTLAKTVLVTLLFPFKKDVFGLHLTKSAITLIVTVWGFNDDLIRLNRDQKPI
jgi:hypothetical protein